MFVKSQHKVTWKKLLGQNKIPTVGKSFEETLIKMFEKQQERIDKLEKELDAVKAKLKRPQRSGFEQSGR